MIPINLEKVLVRQNKRLATPEVLLAIKEYDRLGDMDGGDVLDRVGLGRVLTSGKGAKTRIIRDQDGIKKYKQERVFHISQIREVCNKYYLRFLPTRYYNGVVDVNTPEKISTFEVAYGERCDMDNMYIMAPAKSFKLERRPKDPLLFYRINYSDYYYLVHKWGNDLNLFRRFLPFLSTMVGTWFIPLFAFAAICTLIYLGCPPCAWTIFGVVGGVWTLLYWVVNLVDLADGNLDWIWSLLPRNEFDSKIK